VDGDIGSAGPLSLTIDMAGANTVSGSWLFQSTGLDNDDFELDLAAGLQITSIGLTFSNPQSLNATSFSTFFSRISDGNPVFRNRYRVSAG
jgi:hypothetical protein